MEAIKIQPEHVEAVGDALARAFMTDPICRYVLPDDERRWELMRWMFTRWVGVMGRRGEAYTTPDCAGGALWRPPEVSLWTWVWEQVRAGLLLAPFKLRPAEIPRLVKAHTDATRRMRRSLTSPHWVLDVLGVSPDHHGQGVARCLLTPTLAQADAQGLPCYLITNKSENLPIYARFGFEVLVEGRLPGTRVMMYELRRPSRPEPEREA